MDPLSKLGSSVSPDHVGYIPPGSSPGFQKAGEGPGGMYPVLFPHSLLPTSGDKFVTYYTKSWGGGSKGTVTTLRTYLDVCSRGLQQYSVWEFV